MNYGKELILDLHNCKITQFSRPSIEMFFIQLCEKIDMKRCDLHFWDDLDVPKEDRQTEAHLQGTSAIQFILTSNITIHTLDQLGAVYLNVFSCKSFDSYTVREFTVEWFGGDVVTFQEVIRK